jgi:hypothetical protein
MTDATGPKVRINTKQIVAGSILIGIGTVAAIAGATMAGAALVAAYRERVRQMDVPPSALARQEWDRFVSAASAGMGEWRNGRHPAEGVPR